MQLVFPGIGLIFWTTLAFLIVWIGLAKFAWKPILNAIKEREQSIDDALSQAQKAKEDVQALHSDNERILAEARAERDRILIEAKDAKNKMISEAKDKASEEGKRIIAEAREAIENDKKAAMTDVKNLVASLSIEISEKLLLKNFDSKTEHKEFVERQIQNIKLN